MGSALAPGSPRYGLHDASYPHTALLQKDQPPGDEFFALCAVIESKESGETSARFTLFAGP